MTTTHIASRGVWARALGIAAPMLLVNIAAAHGAGPIFKDQSSGVLATEALQGRSMDAAFADLDGDGLLDLIVASEFGQNVVLLQNEDGFGSSVNALPRGRVHDSEDIGIGDLDNNGLKDVVFVAEDDQVNELYLQTSRGVFVDASDRLPNPGGITNSVLAMDLDEDGDLDLLLGNSGANTLLINDGDARFVADDTGRIPDVSRVTQDIHAGDIDGDGDVDFVLANEDGVGVWVRRELGAYVDATADWIGELPQIEIREADLGDLDNDGDLDLILACVGWRPGNDPRNRVLLNDNGSFRDITTQTPMSGHNTLDGDLVDLDNDGDLDMVWGASSGGPALTVWINDGDASFTDATGAWAPPLSLTHTIDIEAADLNGDGKIDLYIANHVTIDRVLIQE